MWDFQCGSDALRIQMCDHFKTTGAYRAFRHQLLFTKKDLKRWEQLNMLLIDNMEK